jgi:DNA polymerase III subunit epsilon
VIEEYVRTTFGGEEVTLVGHNIGFDVAFLRKLAFEGGREQLAGISHRALDTHTLLYVLALENRIPVSATKSDGAFRHFGIQVPPSKRHTALEDARATRALLLAILDLYVRTPNLAKTWS